MSAEPETLAEVTRDTLLKGRLALLQRRRGHRAGTDAVILAAAAGAVRDGETVVDLGAGTGAVGLIVAARAPGARVLLVEKDLELAALARENVALNGFEERVAIVPADVLAASAAREAAGLEAGSADLVVTNPPFAEAGEMPRSPEVRRASAHELPPGGFARWLETAAECLRHRGRLALIQRADRAARCLSLLEPRFGALRLRAVHARERQDAIRVLITAVKGARTPFSIAPPLVLHGEDGAFTPLVQALHRGEVLP